MAFRSLQQQYGYESYKYKDSQCSKCILLEVDYKKRPNESTNSKKQANELYPIILPIINEYFEDAEVGENAHHAASSPSNQESEGQIEEAEVERTSNKGCSTYDYEYGVQAMIWHQMRCIFDKPSSKQIAYGSGQEHKRKVCLILVSDFAEVDDDGSNCCYCTPVEDKYQCVGSKVNALQLHHYQLNIITNQLC